MPYKNDYNQLVGDRIKNWAPKQFPEKIKLTGQYCIIEPLSLEQHALKLFKCLNQDNPPESWTYLPYGPFEAYEAFQAWLEKTNGLPDERLYTILNVKTQEPIGIAGFLRINPAHGSIEIGHLHFSKSLKKTPAATEAMYLMMFYIFETLKYRRYEWKCDSLNEPSCAAALRLGFKFEGIFRQNYVFKNRNRDTAWYSIIDQEWPDIRAKFEKWLSPTNFDAQGYQIMRLNE